MRPKLFRCLVAALSLTWAARLAPALVAPQGSPNTPAPPEAARLTRLESSLEALRQELKIPAMSAAVVKDQKVLWARGFGYADLERKIPATEHTPYHLASLTKTFASTVLMRLVQEGKVSLDDPVSKYGVSLESDGVVRVKHLLSHTSEGNPGERYRYSGNRFGELDKVVERAAGRSFGEILIDDILDPLGMSESAPNVAPAARTKSPGAGDPRAESEVREAVADLIAGYNSGSVEQIERRVAAQRSGFHGEGGPLRDIVDLDELRGAFKSGVRLKFEMRDLEVAVYGETALATGFFGGGVSRPNGPDRKDGPWRASLVWHRQDGVWRLVHSHLSPPNMALVTERWRQRFDAVQKTLAQGYGLDDKFNPVRIKYPTYFGTSAGLMASVLDMAKYDIAVDRNRFLTKETQRLAFTPFTSTKGEPLPYGLGWFTQDYRGTRLVWHYGYWTGNSSLILKVPERNLTFIAMANTDNLSRPTDLGAGDVLSSPVGMAFLKTFVFPDKFGGEMAEIDWQAAPDALKARLAGLARSPNADVYKKELQTRTRIMMSVGRRDDARRLMRVYGELHLKPLPEELSAKTPVALISEVADDQNRTAEFTLPSATSVRVFAQGEGDGGRMYDYGWIEDAATGKAVWEMKGAETAHAGGAEKNRKVDATVSLPAGRYRLHYKSDDSHSFDNWNALPPEINFWGIALYAN
ncbi:MAG TPA: serine hydrolase [Pyrinomonadaceae bacterium]|nr:serine hydrolase [Pyrinomonadaceae bacterium]